MSYNVESANGFIPNYAQVESLQELFDLNWIRDYKEEVPRLKTGIVFVEYYKVYPSFPHQEGYRQVAWVLMALYEYNDDRVSERVAYLYGEGWEGIPTAIGC